MPAPWNGSCPGEHLSFGSFAIPLAQNLSHRSHAIPLGFTLWNACPVEFGSADPLRGIPQGVHIPSGPVPWNFDSACLGARSDRISEARLDLVNQGHAIPPGFGDSLRKYPIKLHQLREGMEFF